MKRTLVFTNLKGLKRVKRNFGERLDINGFGLEHPLFLFDETKGNFGEVHSFKEPGVYLVFDEISEETLNQSLSSQDLDDFYALRHRKPAAIPSLEPRVVKGENEAYGNYYPIFVDVIENEHPNKLDQLMSRIFDGNIIDPILEMKLNLLHQCLIPKDAPAPEKLDNELKYLVKESAAYEKFWEVKEGIVGPDGLRGTSTNMRIDDPFDKNYIAALTNLRDAFLDG